MKIEKLVTLAERIAAPPCKWCHWVAMWVLLLLMFITVADVVGRYLVGLIPFFGPIPGTFELTEFMLAVAVLTAIGHTQIRGGHISIDLVVAKFPARVRAIIDCVTHFLSLVMFVLVTWQTLKYAHLLYISNDVSGVLRLPVYPFLIVVAIGSFLFCLAMVSTFLKSLKEAMTNEP